VPTYDTQVEPLIQVFALYMLRDAALTDMREPTVVATRAMLDAGLSPEVILGVLDSAVRVAATEIAVPQSGEHAQELRDHVGGWLMSEWFELSRGGRNAHPMD
jgi:hypothetical protein